MSPFTPPLRLSTCSPPPKVVVFLKDPKTFSKLGALCRTG